MFVSNSSTLILLAKINLLETFLDMGEKVIIPKEVYNEFIEKDTALDTLLIKKEIHRGRIIVNSTNKDSIILKEFRLHKGEADAYLLYDKDKHKAILTDDGELIKLCKLEKIPFICSMTILLMLYQKNKIKRSEALEKIDKLFIVGRYSKEIYDYYKEKIN